MSLRQRLQTVLLCFALELGALSGVPMRPEKIQELLENMNRPKVSGAASREVDKGDTVKVR